MTDDPPRLGIGPWVGASIIADAVKEAGGATG